MRVKLKSLCLNLKLLIKNLGIQKTPMCNKNRNMRKMIYTESWMMFSLCITISIFMDWHLMIQRIDSITEWIIMDTIITTMYLSLVVISTMVTWCQMEILDYKLRVDKTVTITLRWEPMNSKNIWELEEYLVTMSARVKLIPKY